MTLYEYTVGKPFPAPIPKNATQTHYVFSAGGHMLVVLIPRPERAEIEAARKAPVELGLYVKDDLFLIFGLILLETTLYFLNSILAIRRNCHSYLTLSMI